MSSYFVIAEGGGEIGMGHIVRQFSLCQLLKIESSIMAFIVTHVPEEDFLTLGQFFPKCNMVKRAADAFESIPDGSLVFLDGYNFHIEELNTIKRNKGLRFIFVADTHKKVPDCEILINHLPWANEINYKDAKIKLRLDGPEFAILRNPFFHRKRRKHKGRILICLGNGKVSDEITAIYHALLDIGFPKEKIDILYHKPIKDLDTRNLHFNKTAEEVCELILDASLCFITPGNISYEVFSVNRPVIMGAVSEEQKEVASKFGVLGLCHYVGAWSSADLSDLNALIFHAEGSKKVQHSVFSHLTVANFTSYLSPYLNLS